MQPIPARGIAIKTIRKIPFFNYPYLFLSCEEEFQQIIRDVLSRGAYILQQDLRDFEQNLAKFLKVKYAFGVANGTDALILALRASGIGPGDEVILPSHTFVATAAAVHFAGARPVLVDCGPDHLMDPVSIEEAVTAKTKAVIPVHLNGRTCSMDLIGAIALRHHLLIIEDAAQALGSQYRGRYAGTFGQAGTFSFYPAKVLGCFGDGGAVVTADDKTAEKIALLRDHGRTGSGPVLEWGFNSRLDNLQAAILNFKLESFPGEIEKRRNLAALYHQGLKDLGPVSLPPPPDEDPDHFDIYQNYEIEADRRDELKGYLDQNGIGTIIQWGGTPVHRFETLGFDVRLPSTEKVFERCLLLPMNSSLTEEDIETITSCIRSFYGAS